MIVIGSRATVFWHPEYKISPRADWDVICSADEAESIIGKIDREALSWHYINTELHNERHFFNSEVSARYGTDKVLYVPDLDSNVPVCSSRGLAAIKRAHLHRSLNFPKHILRYQILDRHFDESDLKFISKRKQLTLEHFPNKVGSKDKSNDDFFNDAVIRVWQHDQLHQFVAFYDQPLYFKLKKDVSKAAYDVDLWSKLSDHEKVQCIQEECLVIALERFLVPWRIKDRHYPLRSAFDRALEKACTTLDNGPFREYAIDNWKEIRECDLTILSKFLEEKYEN